MTSAREELAAIRTFPQLVRYLRDELDWPINQDDFEDLVFDYKPEDLGIDARNAAKIEEIKRLRPLSVHQPWGVFFVKFEPKRLPVVALRRILSGVALRKRASANSLKGSISPIRGLRPGSMRSPLPEGTPCCSRSCTSWSAVSSEPEVTDQMRRRSSSWCSGTR